MVERGLRVAEIDRDLALFASELAAARSRTGGATAERLVSIENVIGSGGADTITGDSGPTGSRRALEGTR